MTEDERIQEFALGMIRRASDDTGEWRFTCIGALRPEILPVLHLDSGEFPLVSAFISPRRWYAFTTRRVVIVFDGETSVVDPRMGMEIKFGNFKGYAGNGARVLGARPTEIARLSSSGSVHQFEYETGNASMAPIYADKYWSLKHPILHKLMTSAERELLKDLRAQKH